MKNKSLYLIGSVAALSLLLAGCGQSSPTNHSTQSNSSSKVVKGQAGAKQGSSQAGTKQSESSSTSQTVKVNDQTVGVFAALLKNPDWFKEGVNSGEMYYGNDDKDMGNDVQGFSYVTSKGDPTSYLYFRNDGTNVTIKMWTAKGAESVAEGHFETTTISLKQLEEDYYSNASKRAEVDGYVNKLKPYSEDD